MAFLNPAAFYLLGIIPVLIALHFLKLRRQRYVVPSMMLWRASAEDQKANVPFQRLRNILLPIIQCLLLLLIITGVARPALRIPGIIQGKIIYIVDNSASMLSRELGETRLVHAKNEVLNHIDQVSADGGMMVMVTHAPSSYIQQIFTTDKEKLRTAVDSIQPTHKGGGLTSVIDNALRYVDTPQDQIYYITDSPENIPVTSVPITIITVGDEAKNIGIVKFRAERIAAQYHVFAAIQNWTDTEQVVATQLELEGGISIDKKITSIPSGKVENVLFNINAEERLDGVAISLHLVDVEDDFEIDNRTWTILNAKNQYRILLVSNRNLSFLDLLLESYGEHVEIQKVSTDEYHGTGDADIVIFDREIYKEQGQFNINPSQGVVYINWQDELPFLKDSSVEVINTPVRVIKENITHPIMQDVSLMNIQIKESVRRKLPLWGVPLVETEKGSIVWIGENVGNQYLVFEFDAFNPEFSPLSTTIPDGPLLIYQCLAWLESGTLPVRSIDRQTDNTGQYFQTGEQLHFELSGEDTSTFRVQKPDGTLVELGSDVFTDTDQIGVYSILDEDLIFERFAVNLLDPNESTLPYFSTESPEIGKETESLQPITQQVWQWVVLFAVGLLICEWWFYHRQ